MLGAYPPELRLRSLHVYDLSGVRSPLQRIISLEAAPPPRPPIGRGYAAAGGEGGAPRVPPADAVAHDLDARHVARHRRHRHVGGREQRRRRRGRRPAARKIARLQHLGQRKRHHDLALRRQVGPTRAGLLAERRRVAVRQHELPAEAHESLRASLLAGRPYRACFSHAVSHGSAGSATGRADPPSDPPKPWPSVADVEAAAVLRAPPASSKSHGAGGTAARAAGRACGVLDGRADSACRLPGLEPGCDAPECEPEQPPE